MKPRAVNVIFPALPPRPMSKTTPSHPLGSFHRHSDAFPGGGDASPPFTPKREPVAVSAIDQSQDFFEEFSVHHDLSHLEHSIAGVAHDLGTGLDQLPPQAVSDPSAIVSGKASIRLKLAGL